MIEAFASSSFATRALAEALAPALRKGDLLMLVGDLGAGKTTFTQGLGKGLGVEEQITSPTFVLLRSYDAALPLHHVDVYRLEHLQEVIDLGLMEMLDEGGVAVVEWGDLAAPVLPRDYLEIRIKFDDADDEARRIELVGVGSNWSERENAVATAIGQWVSGRKQ